MKCIRSFAAVGLLAAMVSLLGATTVQAAPPVGTAPHPHNHRVRIRGGTASAVRAAAGRETCCGRTR